jgi:hypothetical protein
MTSCRTRRTAGESTTLRVAAIIWLCLPTWPRFTASTRFFSRGVSGQGQTIVVVEDTDLYTTADWNTFRSTLGLSGYTSGSFATVHPAPPSGTNNCSDPGVNGDDGEAILDAEWSSAGAPNAAIVLASCTDTTNFGGFIALQNLLNETGTPPAIVSISYGESEPDIGATGNAYINALYQQAVAEGVSVFVSSGDEGAASSDADATHATHGIAVSGYTSTPYNVSVGGTDFGDTYTGTNTTYWASSNTATFGSALSYIPEIPWNDSCAGALLAAHYGYSAAYGTSGFCNSSEGANFLTTAAGSGGPSGCATGAPGTSGVVSGSCAGYPKPSWQSVFGNPSDGVRDIPDVSLFAANGVWGHYYVACFSDTSNGGASCTGAPSTWAGFGGTSISSPIMAAIQALVNQTTGSRSGNPNSTYYSLAQAEYGSSSDASCGSSLGNSASSACVFYDVTAGDMDVNCTGTHNCYLDSATHGALSKSNSAYQPAYGTNTGWDFSAGIGTVNANNLVGNWPRSSNPAILSITSTHTGNFAQGQQNATYTVTVSNAAGAGPTSGTVTVTETIPSGLTLVSMAGTGWTCVTNTCARSDVLGAGLSYPAITVTVNVASNATSPQVNQVGVSGGGSATANGSDSTTIAPLPTGLVAAAGNTQVSLTWNTSAGASSYNVYSSTTNGGPYAEITSVTSPTYTNTGLTNGTAYYFVVTAVDSSGQSGYSGQASATPTAGSSWSNGYASRRAITISHTQVPNTDQSNFPVLISLPPNTYADLKTTANGGSVTNTNGYDILFTSDAAGTLPLAYERESYSGSTGAMIDWVRVATVSHTTNTVIYLFYGNSSVTTDQSNPSGTWDSNYVGVWHLPNGTTLSANDSTSNANNGAITGATATTGQIDGAASLSGTSQYITVGDGSSLRITGNITIEAWINPTDFSDYNGILGKTAGAGGNIPAPYDFYLTSGGGIPEFFSGNGTAYSNVSGSSPPTTGVWSHIAVTLSGGTVAHYLDGSNNGSGTGTATPGDGGTAAVIGSRTDHATMFKGGIDEVRVSNIARSADWIATEYNNQSSPSTFYTVGAALTGGGSSSPAIASLSPTSGAVGASVTITGSNFGSTQGSSTVQFNGTAASVSSWSSTSISTAVPSGATTGNVVVNVNSTSSNGVAFTVVPPPSITSLSTTSGSVGTPVMINGSNFGSSQGAGTVTFNGTAASVTSWTATTIATTVPSGATTGNVVVFASGVNSTGVNFTVLPSTWSNGYTSRRAITISHTQVPNTDQSNFPVLISLPPNTYADLKTTANGGSVTNTNGYDILFTSDAAGTLPLAYERESYSGSTGAMIDWVRVATVSHTTNTVIYLFYGNSSVTTDQSNPSGTWDSNYVGVWHLPNGTTLSANDSTSNANNGAITGATATTGQIDGAASLSGTSQYITVGDGSSLRITGNITIEAWINPTDFSDYNGILGKTAGAGGNIPAPYDFYLTSGGGIPEFFSGNGTAYSNVSGSSPPTTGVWSHIAVTLSGGTVAHYLDGSNNGSGTGTATPGDGGTAAVIGSRTDHATMFKGGIDEVRVSNIARSADWIATEYNNQSSPSTFYTVGAALTGGGSSSPAIASLSPTSGAVGASVTITGSNFGSTQGSSTVQFNGTAASVSSWSSTSISTAVPSGATTGNVVVNVNSTSSNGVAFTVVPPPSITSLSTTSGSVGTPVMINGSNFGSSQGAGTVTFNGTAASVTSWTATTIATTVPSGATTGNVVVFASGVNSTGVNFTVLPSTWSNGYTSRRAITISHTQVPNTDQSNFPVLISLPPNTYADLKTTANGGSVTNTNGYDILFTSDAAGTLPLAYERESYSGSTGAMIDWVRVATVSHTTNTVIYLFYGNSSVTTDQSNPSGTWDSNYVGVWHLPNGTTLSANDSTSNANNGAITGATATTGQIDGAASLSGTSQYITVGDGSSLRITGNITIEAWINPTDFSDYNGILGKTAGAGGNIPAPYDFYLTSGGGIPEFFSGNGTAYSNVSGSSPPNTGVWSHIAVTLSGSTVAHYLDGSNNGSGTGTATPGDGGTAAIIGSRTDHATMFKGDMDEVRVSNIARSADWIATEYNNQSSPSTFYTVGAAVTGGGG